MINGLQELSQQEVLIRNTVLLPNTNQENSRGAKKKEETPAHNMFCQTPRNLALESILAERCEPRRQEES